MMIITGTTTVREVALLPLATKVLEKLKIDYCCGGDKPLVEACVSAGIEVDSLVKMLAEANAGDVTGPLDLQTASLTELIIHIMDNHHVYSRTELARLEPLTEKVIAAHGDSHPELRRIGRLFHQLSDDLKPHMFKEEETLFPYLVQLEKAVLKNGPVPFATFGSVDAPVLTMITEHERVGRLLRELRAASVNYSEPADACLSYQSLYQGLAALEKDLHQHIHLENNLLFPRAVEMEEKLMARSRHPWPTN